MERWQKKGWGAYSNSIKRNEKVQQKKGCSNGGKGSGLNAAPTLCKLLLAGERSWGGEERQGGVSSSSITTWSGLSSSVGGAAGDGSE